MARGTLRIYLGAAPGVGKTFAMLGEGRRRAERGTDVVVGYVETHGRPKTAAQIADLEVIPRRTVEYRGTTLEEMDVDAILARRPQVVLVDELAHTNAPGSRNAKRWQDVEELLDAGITVISTVNIQHLESVNDVVERITGITQQETIPDAVARRAAQIELVDMAPEAIRRRMAHGNIYAADRIDTALANYFRPGNLGALRELALLWVADRVDEALEDYRARHGIDRPWETRERVLVALTGSPDGERLVRRAARMAARARGDLLAVHVVSQDGLAGDAAEQLGEQRRLVEELGGLYREVVGTDVGVALVQAARSLNATQIVLGATRRSLLAELTRGSVINRVIRASGIGLDVHVISRLDTDDTRPTVTSVSRVPAVSRRRLALGLVVGCALLPAITAILTALRPHVSLGGTLLTYLLAVVVISAVGGVWPALVSAVAAFLIANWYFTPPIHTFTISEGDELVALIVFLAVAGIVSGFVAVAARRALEGARARAEATALKGLAGTPDVPTLLEELRRATGVDRVELLDRADPAGPATGEPSLTIDVDTRQRLRLTGGIASVDQRIVEAFAAELAGALRIAELEREAAAADALGAADALRTAILSAVSHDLRSPLVGIKASVSSLLQDDVDWTPSQRRELLETIEGETDRLNGLVGNLLDMSRVHTGTLQMRRAPVGLDEVVPNALRSLGPRASGVVIEIPETLPRVVVDAGLLERAIANIVANAVAASPAGVPVRVMAGSSGPDTVQLRVVDRGRGIHPDERERVFLPFQRLGDSAAGEGVGLGLAVARGFIEAMDGRIEIDDTPGGGVTMVVELPAER